MRPTSVFLSPAATDDCDARGCRAHADSGNDCLDASLLISKRKSDTNLAVRGGGDHHVANAQGAGLHQQRGDGATPPVKVRLHACSGP